MSLELLDHTQSKFSERVQVLLNDSINNAAEIFRVVNIQNPVHRFHRPFHPGMMEQLQRGKIAAGDIVVPFFRFYTVSLKLGLRAIGEKLFANSGKKRYNEFEVKKDVKH